METITVLVVDNDRAANRTLHDGLSDVGFNVLTTNTELDGLEDLQYGTNIDVVLLDYTAPMLDDSRALKQLNNQFPNAKAIGMTRSNTSKFANMYRSDVEKLLHAPIKLPDLVAAIHSVLGLSVSKTLGLRSRGATRSRDRAQLSSVSAPYWTRLAISTALFLIASYSILKFFGLLLNTALFSR